MLKAYYFLWRRPGMSRAEFIEYYEERHASLIISNLLPASDFRRNYPRWSETHSTYVGAAPFDALTAITYPNRAQFEDSMHTYRSPPFSQIVTEDELRFIDRQRVRFVPVHEVVDRVNHDEWFPAPLEAGSAKLFRLTRRPPDVDSDAFRHTFETEEVPEIRSRTPGCTDYRRNYLCSADEFCFMTPVLQAEIQDHRLTTCDLIEEFCFQDEGTATRAAGYLDESTPVADVLAGMKRTPAVACDQRGQRPPMGT